MNATIQIGAWIFPTLISLLIVIAALCWPRPERSYGGYFPDMGAALVDLAIWTITIIALLITWLIYFIIT